MRYNPATIALFVLVVLSAAPARAQAAAQGEAADAEELWRGSLSLGIQVTDDNGQPLAGAIVALRFAGDGTSAGPPLLETDEEGRAELTSVAAGEWQADVRRDGYMLFTAYLHLAPGEAPELGFRTRQRTGSFWAPLEVRFYDPERVVELGGGRILSAENGQKEERRIAKQERRKRKREDDPDVAVVVEESPFEVAAATPRESASPPVIAPVQPAPSAVEESAPAAAAAAPPASQENAARPEPSAPVQTARPRPAPEQQRAPSEAASVEPPPSERLAPAAPAAGSPEVTRADVEPTLPGPVEEVAPATVAPPAPVADRPTSPPAVEAVETPSVAAGRAEPAAPESAAALEAPAPEPGAVAVDRPAEPPLRLPTIRPNPNLLPAGACPECRAGEWSLAVDGIAAPRRGAGGCDATYGDRLGRASALVAQTLPAQLRDYAGSLVDSRGGDDVLRLLPPEAGRRVTELLDVEEAGGCQVIGIVLPRGARYIGFRYQAADARSGLDECPPDGDCQIGEARWLGNPVLERFPEMTVVYALFENRSTERERRPRFIVYFKPRSGWAPPAR